MTRGAKVGLVLTMGGILTVGHLLDRDLSDRSGRIDVARLRRALLLQPFEDQDLPAVPDTAPDGGPAPREPELYEVQEGETLGAIAKKKLGSTAGWKAFLHLNRDVLPKPELLRPGMRLKVPGPSWREWLARREGRPVPAARAAPAPARERERSRPHAAGRTADAEAAAPRGADERGVYVVQKGDTLGGIAQRTMGGARFAQKLFEANKDVMKTPDRLDVGMRLRVPEH